MAYGTTTPSSPTGLPAPCTGSLRQTGEGLEKFSVSALDATGTAQRHSLLDIRKEDARHLYRRDIILIHS